MKTKRKIFASVLVLIATILISQLGFSEQPKFSWDFQEAVWSGNVEAVKKIIRQNPGWVNEYRFSSSPPLVEAAQHGKLEIVEFFVTNNADINAKGVFGRTALHIAANNGDAKMVELLLKHKANVNTKDDDGLAPIIQSIKSVEVVKLLLACGADINTHGGRNTLYSQAIENPRGVGPGVIEFVLTNGVDVTVSGEEGISQAVLFNNDTNLIKMLAPLYITSQKPIAMQTLRGILEETLARNSEKMASTILSVFIQVQTNSLQKAVALGDDAAIRSILATNPAAVNNKDFFGWTPLHLAAISGKAGIAKMLISNQADVDVQDDIANSPLHWAAFYGHEDLVKLLLQHKANIDSEGNTQGNNQYISDTSNVSTPLDFAIHNGFTSIAVMLVTNGANLDSHTWWRDTPLHIATGNENVELMKLLLAHGASINAVRGANYKQSPLDIAVCGNLPEAVQLLMTNGASLQTRMQTHSGGSTTLFHLWAERGGNTNIAELLLAAGCNLNATNGDGQTPLHLAIQKWGFTRKLDPDPSNTNRADLRFIVEDSGSESALWLLKHKADANAKDNNGQTPLHLIVTRGNLKAIQGLLAYKADVNAKDKKGKTPLALFEDLKISEENWGHGWLMQVDIKAVENLLVKYGATDPIRSSRPNAGMHGY